MRRISLSLFLAAGAGAAAFVAPRLVGTEAAPVAQEPVEVAPAQIPEVDAPVEPVKEVPDEFWRDMVDCGMG